MHVDYERYHEANGLGFSQWNTSTDFIFKKKHTFFVINILEGDASIVVWFPHWWSRSNYWWRIHVSHLPFFSSLSSPSLLPSSFSSFLILKKGLDLIIWWPQCCSTKQDLAISIFLLVLLGLIGKLLIN